MMRRSVFLWALVTVTLVGCDLPAEDGKKKKATKSKVKPGKARAALKAAPARLVKAPPRQLGPLKAYRYKTKSDKNWQKGKARVGQPINPGGGRWQTYLYKGEKEIVAEIGPPFRINGKVVGLSLSPDAPLKKNLALIQKHKKHLELIHYESASKVPAALIKAMAALPAKDLSLDLERFQGAPGQLQKIARLGHRLAHLSLYGAAVENDDGALRIDRHLGFLRHCTRLWHLGIGGTNLTDRGLGIIRQMVWLRTLMLSDTKVTDKGVLTLKPLTNLETLWVPEKTTDKTMKTLKASLKKAHIVN